MNRGRTITFVRSSISWTGSNGGTASQTGRRSPAWHSRQAAVPVSSLGEIIPGTFLAGIVLPETWSLRHGTVRGTAGLEAARIARKDDIDTLFTMFIQKNGGGSR